MKHLTVLALLLPVFACAQINPGARVTALGGAGVALKDVWAIQKNQAGLAGISQVTLALNFEQRLLTDDVTSQSALLAVPISKNIVALSFQRYGFTAFNQQKSSLALARKFGPALSGGISINFHQLKITNYGSSHALTAEAGFQYQPNKNLTFGAQLSNPSNSGFDDDISADLPMAISIGTAYRFSDKVLVTGELEKVLRHALSPKMGLEYSIVPWLDLRGGVAGKPFRQFAGLGARYKSIQFDSTISSDSSLGYSPQIGISYGF